MRSTFPALKALIIATPIALVAAGCGGGDGPDGPSGTADAAVDQADGKAGAAGSGGADASEADAGVDAMVDAVEEAPVEAGDNEAAVELDADDQDVSALDGGSDASDEAALEAGPDAPPEPPLPVQLRVAAANLTSENGQSYDPGHGIRILKGIHADIVLIQEFKYGDNTDTAFRSFVDTTFEPTFAYYRETGALLPNGVISRYPIAEAGKWTDPEVYDRGFAWARIDIPGPRDLFAVSVHLLNTGTVTERNNEAKALMGYINAKVPSLDALVVIGGDMNTPTRTESCYGTLAPRFVTAGPWPVDQNNNSNTNAKRLLPYDWVIASKPLDPLEVPVVIGSNTFTNGLVVDTRVHTPNSDISPALPDDSKALNMQHMAVVREFLIN